MTPTLFDDAALWLAVRERVVPRLRTYPSVNVWVSGCGDGAAAFTAAVVLRESGLLARARVWATERDEAALDRAREAWVDRELMGRAAEGYRASGGPSSLDEYYALDGARAVLRECVTERVVFAQHDPATDGSFNEFQFVVCLGGAALSPEVAARRLGVVRESLCRFGFLALGEREPASVPVPPFEPFAGARGLYRKVQ